MAWCQFKYEAVSLYENCLLLCCCLIPVRSTVRSSAICVFKWLIYIFFFFKVSSCFYSYIIRHFFFIRWQTKSVFDFDSKNESETDSFELSLFHSNVSSRILRTTRFLFWFFEKAFCSTLPHDRFIPVFTTCIAPFVYRFFMLPIKKKWCNLYATENLPKLQEPVKLL